MSTKVTIDIDPADAILLKRHLQDNGPAQLFFANEVARLCDPYVPMQQGMLKNTKEITTGSVTYVQPYAQKQYYENKGNGLRGSYWDKRMWTDRGDEVVKSIAMFVGGVPG